MDLWRKHLLGLWMCRLGRLLVVLGMSMGMRLLVDRMRLVRLM